ncbi:VCBS domain-containing protein [Psychromonas sp. 14N.309.X.WAT.B.A12]|uniref:chondroitinase-B domain-containing protein n=1 Tax=Psychromonas sp. 14N.309.X.WAT.B.A12 TaxID=2998322 RepID=UPI0025AEECEF|nr:chondroitinase-B domain-containing protein [Psychromonas sp. 14N.309.X.WAT.B.A12]MDN2663039.1 VCBS domain-containing protein [Psychromonas sp. 14N.309.X.WAT.B.A12]
MYKKILLFSAMAGLTACGGSSDSSNDANVNDDVLSSSTAAVISGATEVELYYKNGDVNESLTIIDPDDGEEAFVVQSSIATTYGIFSLDSNGEWTYEVPENETLGDLNEDESVSDSVTVTSIDGTEATIRFTILSADALSEDNDSDNDEDNSDDALTYTCSDAFDDDGSDDANPVVTGATHNSTTDDLNELLNSGDVQGGDEIIVSGDGEISIKDTCFDAQVLIRAESIGSTTLETAAISNSQNITIQGFVLGPNDASTLLKIVNSKNIKVLRNTFDHKDITDGQTSVVLTESSEEISIAYNEFLDKNIVVEDEDGQINSGSYIKFQYDDDTETMATNAHIHHNYFKNIVPYVKAGNTTPEGDADREAIVFGDSGSQDVETNHLIEYNLFEDTDGENEIMTVKTSNNTFSNNTFLNSMGSLSFRLGHDNKAENNYFYGTGDSTLVTDANYETGGIRVYGANHTVSNNYMENLSGSSWRSPILIDSGDVSDSSNGNSHEAPTNVTVVNNTLVNNLGGGIFIGRDNYSIVPKNITISDNLVTGNEGSLFNNYANDESNTWSGNQSYATGSAVDNEDGTLGASELEVLSSEPATTPPSPLTRQDVGPTADLSS